MGGGSLPGTKKKHDDEIILLRQNLEVGLNAIYFVI